MKKNKVLIGMMICIMCIFMSGCWDRVEIDKKIFISSIAIDSGENISQEKILKSSGIEFPLVQKEIKKLRVTYGFPDLKNIKQGTTETQNITVDSYSVSDAASKAASKSSRSIYIDHAKLLLLSSDILKHKDTVKEIIDYVQRHPSFNRTSLVLVCDGRCEDYIKFKPIMEKNVESYIIGIMQNSERNNSIPIVNLNKFLSNLSENGNCLVPKIKFDKTKNEIILDGMSIIKDYKVIGELSNDDVAQVRMLKGKLKGGKKSIVYKEHPIDYVIDGSAKKISVKKINEKLVFNIDVNLEGKVYGHSLDIELLNEKELDNIEKSFNKVIKSQCERFMQVSQEKYRADFIGLDEYIRKYKPSLWNETGKKWDEQFKNSTITVNVHTDIRRIGVTK